jgi:hypothetical protein
MPKKKLNSDQKRARRAADLSTFVRQYGRKAQKGVEPNDRRYDREIGANAVRRLKPTVMDELLRDDEEV